MSIEIAVIDRESLERMVYEAVRKALADPKPSTQPRPEPERMSIHDASLMTGLKVSTIYRKVHDGSIPYKKFAKRLVFFRSELMKWMEESTVVRLKASDIMDMRLADASRRKH